MNWNPLGTIWHPFEGAGRLYDYLHGSRIIVPTQCFSTNMTLLYTGKHTHPHTCWPRNSYGGSTGLRNHCKRVLVTMLSLSSSWDDLCVDFKVPRPTTKAMMTRAMTSTTSTTSMTSMTNMTSPTISQMINMARVTILGGFECSAGAQCRCFPFPVR